MAFRLVALVTYNWHDDEETLLELFFHSQENAEQWAEEHRDQYQSFHYVITNEIYNAIIKYYEDDEDDEEFID